MSELDAPAHLAEKILRDRAQLEGERRTVTVLFVDEVGSTSLGERLDEEEVYELMQGAIALMREAMHRYEGMVAQSLGDGIMALFGAPIAHEDAAHRAVAAGLAMQHSLADYVADARERYGLDVAFRAGLNTGPVVVGRIGNDLHMDYTAVGDTTNLAKRMEENAEPGTLYASERTYRATRDFFEFADVGTIAVKGKAKPVRAYKALRELAVRTRFEAATTHTLTPLVGRNDDLSVLSGHLERARGGEGQVVLVSGEAGIGKSRLLLEFQRSLASDGTCPARGLASPHPPGLRPSPRQAKTAPTRVRWLEGRCISFGRNIPYLPLIDVLKQAFGIDEGDSEEAIVARVDEASAGWEGPARATVPYLKFLLNVNPCDPTVARMDPRERRAGVLDALRALTVVTGRSATLVIVIEDLHWADEQSLEAIRALVDVVASNPVLLVVTYRPGHPPSIGDRSYFHRFTLRRLEAQQTVAVAEAVLHTDSLPAELAQLVTTKGEGNPFYIEEVTKALLETGAVGCTGGTCVLERPLEELRLPDTIQDVILSRIDRLDPPAREVLQLASVIGREFTVRLLERMTGHDAGLEEPLGELKALELIYEKAYFPELSYMFKHALTHDVAYSTLLHGPRKSLHRVVAAAIEELYAERLAEHYETLAHHYYEGEDWQKALDYFLESGDKAAAVYANEDALLFYDRALEVCDKLGEEVLDVAAEVAQARGQIAFRIGDVATARAAFGLLQATARRLADRRLEGRSLVYRGLVEFFAHEFDACEEAARAALAIGEEGGFNDVRLGASAILVMVSLALNRHAEAEQMLRVAEALVPRVHDPFTLGLWGWVGFYPRHWAGRFDEALAHLSRWREETARDTFWRLFVMWQESLSRAGRGEYGAALAVLDELLALSERVGDMFVRTRALNTKGWMYRELQDLPRALEWNRRSLDLAHEIDAPNPEVESNARLNLGDSLFALGRLDEAEEHYRWVEEVVRNPKRAEAFMVWRYSQHLFHSYGSLRLARGDTDRALAYADECLALAEHSGSRKNLVKGHRLRGEALAARGELDEAERELERGREMAREVGNPLQLWRTAAALGRLRSLQGRHREAAAAWDEAVAVIGRVTVGLRDEQLRATFVGSTEVQTVRDAARRARSRAPSGAPRPPSAEGH